MISRVCWGSIACLAVLAAASPCLAADSTGAVPRRGGVGGKIGGSFFYADADYSMGAQPRFDFAGSLRYVFTPWLRFQFSPEFTWSAYAKDEPVPFTDPGHPGDVTKEQYLTLLLPVHAQLQFTVSRGQWIYYLGAGPGVYRVIVENRRDVLKDPLTLKLHRGLYPGVTGELGAERFLRALPNTSIDFSLANHFVFAVRDEQFPAGFNSNISAIAARVGANYYFDLNRSRRPAVVPLPGIER
jgi:hypothetical protein